MEAPSKKPPAPETPFQILVIRHGDSQVNQYTRRRSHRKTRAGCMRCKLKRVKCDEQRPKCRRCEKNKVACSFPSTLSGSITTSNTETNYERTTLLYLQAPSPFEQESKPGFSTYSLFRNFEQQWIKIFGMPWSSLPISIVHAHAHVRLSILALSTCHLRHHLPDPTIACKTEHMYQALALRAYQVALNTPFDVLGQDGTDALLVTAMIFNTLSFALPSQEDAGGDKIPDVSWSWVFSPRKDRLSWLAIEMGLKPLLRATRQYREGSALVPIFDAADDDKRTLTSNGLSLDNVPKTWLIVFGLLDVDSPQARIFREPLRLIAEIRHLQPTPTNILPYVQFIGKMTNEFRSLLFDRDSRALWLFGYWLGLMCRLEKLWWLNRRPRRDFKAVCQWFTGLNLNEQEGSKGVLWKEMMRDLEQASCLPH